MLRFLSDFYMCRNQHMFLFCLMLRGLYTLLILAKLLLLQKWKQQARHVHSKCRRKILRKFTLMRVCLTNILLSVYPLMKISLLALKLHYTSRLHTLDNATSTLSFGTLVLDKVTWTLLLYGLTYSFIKL